jgi:DNA-binding CsgD family transcriptional regulator
MTAAIQPRVFSPNTALFPSAVAQTVSSRVLGRDEALGPFARAVAVLDAFELPYVIVALDGTSLRASPALAETLGDAAPEFWMRVTELIPSQLPLGTHRRGEPNSRKIPVCRGRLAVSVHSLWGAHGVIALVLVHPGAAAETMTTASAAGLTDREARVAHLLATGMAIKEIGAALGISAHTARHHTERIYTKLGVRNRVAVAAAMGVGVVPGESRMGGDGRGMWGGEDPRRRSRRRGSAGPERR